MPYEVIGMKTVGIIELADKLEQVSKDMRGSPFIHAMKAAAVLVARTAKQPGYVPVDTGRLRASITPEVYSGMGREVVGVVGTNVKYAPYQEFGTDPFFPPVSALERWARRHGVSAWGVAIIISRLGLRALRYLQRALDDSYPRVRSIIERAVGNIVEK